MKPDMLLASELVDAISALISQILEDLAPGLLRSSHQAQNAWDSDESEASDSVSGSTSRASGKRHWLPSRTDAQVFRPMAIIVHGLPAIPCTDKAQSGDGCGQT